MAVPKKMAHQIEDTYKLASLHLKRGGEFIWSVLVSFGEHECAMRAASLAYYGLFSIFPMLLFFVYLGSRVFSMEDARAALDAYVLQALPGIAANLERVLDQVIRVRSSVGIISAISLAWSGSAVFGVLEMGLNVIWEGDNRSFWRRRLLAIAVVVTLSFLYLAALTLGPVLSLLLKNLSLDGFPWLGRVFGSLAILFTSFLLYRVFPCRPVPWKPALAGALAATGLIEGGQFLFSLYLGQALRNYGSVYGSIAWIVALVLWTYVVALLFFLGAEVGAMIDKRRIR